MKKPYKLGMLSGLSYIVASPLSAVGFIAWGLVLPIITALLTVKFRSFKDNRQI